MTSQRWAGTVFLAAALGVALEARTFTVGFPTDPLGPAALPFLAAAILAAGGALLLARPEHEPEWPERLAWLRGVSAAVGMLAYALLLPWVGFFLATSLVMTALSTLFGGPLVRSALAAGAYVGVLHLVFGELLELPLPIGRLFIIGAP